MPPPRCWWGWYGPPRRPSPKTDRRFAYDAETNLTGYIDSSGTTSHGCDAANNLTSLVEPGGTSRCTVSPKNTTSLCPAFAYNANGQRTTTQYPGGAAITVA